MGHGETKRITVPRSVAESRPGLRRLPLKATAEATVKDAVPGSFMALQRTAGNRAVAALVAAARSGHESLLHQTEVEAKLGLPLGEVRAQVDRADLLGPVGVSAAATPAGVLFAEEVAKCGHRRPRGDTHGPGRPSGEIGIDISSDIAGHDSAAEREAESFASSARASGPARSLVPASSPQAPSTSTGSPCAWTRPEVEPRLSANTTGPRWNSR